MKPMKFQLANLMYTVFLILNADSSKSHVFMLKRFVLP